MPMKRLHVAMLVLFLAVGTSFGAAFAEDTTAAQPAPAAPLSQSEQEAAAKGIVDQGTQLSTRVGKMLDDARQEGDIIRLTCLNDKLTEVNAVLRNTQTRAGSLGDAVSADARNHEFTVLTVLGQKFKVLEQEANQCVGQDLYEAGATKVVTEINPDLLPFEDNVGNPVNPLPTGLPTIPPSSVPETPATSVDR
jgi:hypothetical protein